MSERENEVYKEFLRPQVRFLLDEINTVRQPHIDAYLSKEKPALPDALQSIFRQSFKFSAGSPSLQAMIQVRAAQFLTVKLGSVEELANVAHDLKPELTVSQVPKQHAQGRQMQRAEARIPAIWDLFIDICQDPWDLTGLQPKDKMTKARIADLELLCELQGDIPLNIASIMTIRELDYMDQGRPNRVSESQKYKSYIRENGVLGISAGNDEVDLIMAEVGAYAWVLGHQYPEMTPEMYYVFQSTNILKLKDNWEQHHQEKFFPAEMKPSIWQ